MARSILSHPRKPAAKPVAKPAAINGELEKLISSHQDRLWQALAVLKLAVKASEQEGIPETTDLEFAMDAAISLIDPVASGLSLESLRHSATIRTQVVKEVSHG